VTWYYNSDKENNAVVIFDGVIYDVKEYMANHPGGLDAIEDLLGKSIDKEFEEAEHTKFAKNIFKKLPIRGYIASSQTDKVS